jgi:hypothetical protein
MIPPDFFWRWSQRPFAFELAIIPSPTPRIRPGAQAAAPLERERDLTPLGSPTLGGAVQIASLRSDLKSPLRPQAEAPRPM